MVEILFSVLSLIRSKLLYSVQLGSQELCSISLGVVYILKIFGILPHGIFICSPVSFFFFFLTLQSSLAYLFSMMLEKNMAAWFLRFPSCVSFLHLHLDFKFYLCFPPSCSNLAPLPAISPLFVSLTYKRALLVCFQSSCRLGCSSPFSSHCRLLKHIQQAKLHPISAVL